MFSKGFTLFRLLGFEVRLDASWFFLALLIVWSLARGVFPHVAPGLQEPVYWIMAVSGAVGLFLSIILHELSHSLVARHVGIPMKGITLFIFGGVAQMDREPESPRSEFLMALAGPVASLALAFVFGGLHHLGRPDLLPPPVHVTLAYLALINTVLAVFNLIPAFPLDGGRMLRAGLWAWKKDLPRATRIASGIGAGFGMFLLFLGLLSIFGGNFIGGLWWCMIGLFLRAASQGSYQRLITQHTLQGEPVRRFMISRVITVPRSLSIEDLVHQVVYQHHHKLYPVVEGDHLLGCITTRQIKRIPRGEWTRHTVGECTGACSAENSIGPDEDAMEALNLMHRTGNSRLLVVQAGHLLGILSLKDLLAFLSLKLDLEGSAPAPG